MKICSQNPIWNFTTKLIVDEATPQNLLLEVFDADLGKVEPVLCLSVASWCFPSGRPTWQGDDRCAQHCRAQAALWPVDPAPGEILHNNNQQIIVPRVASRVRYYWPPRSDPWAARHLWRRLSQWNRSRNDQKAKSMKVKVFFLLNCLKPSLNSRLSQCKARGTSRQTQVPTHLTTMMVRTSRSSTTGWSAAWTRSGFYNRRRMPSLGVCLRWRTEVRTLLLSRKGDKNL